LGLANFGKTVAVHGTRLAVAAPPEGAVYVYERSLDGRWGDPVRLQPDDVQRGTQFGMALAMTGDLLAVGAPDDVVETRRSSVYLYRRDEQSWRQTAHLRASDSDLDEWFGGSLALQVAAAPQPAWPIRSVVAVSGGGNAPDNDARKVLSGYNGRREEMRELLKVLFFDERWWADDLVEERWRASREPGAWEACAASRLAPEGQVRAFRPERPDYTKIRCPVLIVAGEGDLLRVPNYWKELEAQIPRSTSKVFERSSHCSHIEHARAFNQLAIEFLKSQA
jgi:pimeloyl-ACP methyl ester carboxylesterase